ncbi:hypothetical protein SLS56_011375 [Neofusicoccum ribis]|uniref:Signal peptidase complex subunit 1 n=1 Tax=Neofusicoccum ribis TaxID=45134 RepID=A0ABR3SBT5_9PEZI
MADDLLEKARDLVEGQIIVAFIVGYSTQDIALALRILLAGAVLTFVAVVPPWPFFNKNPATWLPPQSAVTGGVEVEVT